MNLEIIVNIMVIVVALGLVGFSFTKYWANEQIKKVVQSAIDFSDKLGGTNRDKLVRAVTYIENIILSKTPLMFRGFVDFIINSEKIANLIERRLTEIKNVQLKFGGLKAKK